MSPQERLRLVMTPIWNRRMGRRLCVIRMKQGKTQAELAASLTSPQQSISQQQVADMEFGRFTRCRISWAGLEAILGTDTSYVLIGANPERYNTGAIWDRYHERRWRTLRKRHGVDPKKA